MLVAAAAASAAPAGGGRPNDAAGLRAFRALMQLGESPRNLASLMQIVFFLLSPLPLFFLPWLVFCVGFLFCKLV